MDWRPLLSFFCVFVIANGGSSNLGFTSQNVITLVKLLILFSNFEFTTCCGGGPPISAFWPWSNLTNGLASCSADFAYSNVSYNGIPGLQGLQITNFTFNVPQSDFYDFTISLRRYGRSPTNAVIFIIFD